LLTQSAVGFPGKFRLHVALTISDLDKSKEFYKLLLGVGPRKERPRYAKFEPVDPSVNLTLNAIDGKVHVVGGSAHFGVQVKSVDQRPDATDLPVTVPEQCDL
jgi:catechol 2,3-dioxygenase-like lactoylglutathione lyase family enzyme